jgi:hypothetical protein
LLGEFWLLLLVAVAVFVIDLHIVERRDVKSPFDEYNEGLFDKSIVKPQQVKTEDFFDDR